MLQIEPNKDYPLTWNTPDPTDSTTYYPRAYIYDHDGTLLDTVNLTSLGSGRWLYEYHMPADPTGEGRHISVWTKIFTDATYTTESNLYTRVEEKFLVKKGYNPVYGGGGGSDVDYKKLRKIVQEEIKNIKIPQQKEVDLSPLLKALVVVNRSIQNIDIPQPEKVDFSNVVKAIDNVQKEVKGIYIPQPKETDLRPVLKEISKAKLDKVQKAADELLKNIKSFFVNDIAEIKQEIATLKDNMKKMSFVVMEDEKEPEAALDKKAYRKYL